MHGFVLKIGLFYLILLANSMNILLSVKLSSIIIKAISVFQVLLLLSLIEHVFKEILLVGQILRPQSTQSKQKFFLFVSLWHYASDLIDNHVQLPGNFSVVILYVILHF